MGSLLILLLLLFLTVPIIPPLFVGLTMKGFFFLVQAFQEQAGQEWRQTEGDLHRNL